MIVSVQVINRLWQSFYQKNFQELKRNHKAEIERHMSNPSVVYETIRHRNTHSTPLEKINRTYGSVVRKNRSSPLTSLIEDDV